MAGCLGQADAARDQSVVDRRPKVAANLGADLRGKVRPSVVHRQEHSLDREPRVEVIANEMDGSDELAEPLEGVVVALEGNEDRVRSRKRVHREEPERWCAVDQDEVVGVGERANRPSQAALPTVHRGELNFCPGQCRCRRNELNSGTRDSNHSIGDAGSTHQDVVNRAPDRPTVDTQPTRGVTLRIQIDDEDPVSGESEISGEVHHRRRLSDAAFLVGAGNCLAHSVPRPDVIHAQPFYQNGTLPTSAPNGHHDRDPAGPESGRHRDSSADGASLPLSGGSFGMHWMFHVKRFTATWPGVHWPRTNVTVRTARHRGGGPARRWRPTGPQVSPPTRRSSWHPSWPRPRPARASNSLRTDQAQLSGPEPPFK